MAPVEVEPYIGSMTGGRCAETRATARCQLTYGHAGVHSCGSGPWPETFVDEVYEARCVSCGLLSTHMLFEDARVAADAHTCPAAANE